MRYTDPRHAEYDPEFDREIRKVRPDWFEMSEVRIDAACLRDSYPDTEGGHAEWLAELSSNNRTSMIAEHERLNSVGVDDSILAIESNLSDLVTSIVCHLDQARSMHFHPDDWEKTSRADRVLFGAKIASDAIDSAWRNRFDGIFPAVLLKVVLDEWEEIAE